MSDEELKAELERLRKENEALKKGASSGIRKGERKGSSLDLRNGALSSPAFFDSLMPPPAHRAAPWPPSGHVCRSLR
jgi:hypothetical protein